MYDIEKFTTISCMWYSPLSCLFILVSFFVYCLLKPSGICNIDEVKACRSVWGSLLNTYLQSLSHHARNLNGGTVHVLMLEKVS